MQGVAATLPNSLPQPPIPGPPSALQANEPCQEDMLLRGSAFSVSVVRPAGGVKAISGLWDERATCHSTDLHYKNARSYGSEGQDC